MWNTSLTGNISIRPFILKTKPIHSSTHLNFLDKDHLVIVFGHVKLMWNFVLNGTTFATTSPIIVSMKSKPIYDTNKKCAF